MRSTRALWLAGRTATRRSVVGAEGFVARRSLSDGATAAVFNRRVKRHQRNRAARAAGSREFDYLRDSIGRQLLDRLYDVNREFPVAADIGCGTGHLLHSLEDHGGIQTLYMLDMAEEALLRDAPPRSSVLDGVEVRPDGRRVVRLVGDEEFLPFADQSLDLVLSNLSLHWVNDLPSTLEQVRRVLKPDGVFLASVLGGDTLPELRTAMAAAEIERLGGVSPRVSPMMQVADAGNLLTSAGFALPTVDTGFVQIEFDSALHVMEHLQGMGEGNAALQRRGGASADLLLATAAIYQALHPAPAADASDSSTGAGVGVGTGTAASFVDVVASADRPGGAAPVGASASPPVFESWAASAPTTTRAVDPAATDAVSSVLASFQVIYMIGWAPAQSQPKPLPRGSRPKGFGVRAIPGAPTPTP